MKRSSAFLLSALLSLLVTSAYIVYTNREPTPVGHALAAPPSAANEVYDPTNAFLSQERALQNTVADMKSRLEVMDAEYASKIQEAQQQISRGQEAVQAKESSIAASQVEFEALQAALSQDAASYEQQIAALQANETQLRQNLDATLAAIESAQNELSMQQSAGTVNADNGSSGYSGNDDDNEHDGHEENEHEHDDD